VMFIATSGVAHIEASVKQLMGYGHETSRAVHRGPSVRFVPFSLPEG
jgi:hypothetical protein